MNSNSYSQLKVAGYGELLFDHIFHQTNKNVTYIRSGGGGTVSNILANLASFGLNCTLMGVYGLASPYGSYAKLELEMLGVNTELLQPVANKYSRTIYQVVEKNTNSTPLHQFFGRCVICKEKVKSSSLVATRHGKTTELWDWISFSALIMDNLTNDRMTLLHRAKSANPNIIAILDIGRLGHLRYWPIGRIVNWLQKFDIAFVNEDTIKVLLQRLEVNLEDIHSFFFEQSQLRAIIVLKGENGTDLYFKACEHVATHSVRVKRLTNIEDTAGAGDALIASFIKNLFGTRPSSKRLEQLLTEENTIMALETAMREMNSVLLSIGARGHLYQTQKASTNLPTRDYYYLDTEEIRHRVKDLECCPFCQVAQEDKQREEQIVTPQDTMKKKTGINRIISELPKRTLSSLERFEAMEKCREVLSSKSTVCIIGTGGSLAAAHYIKQVFSTQSQSMAQVMRPFDYYRGMAQKTDWLIIVTHSGATSDCGLAIKHGRELGVRRIVLVTHPKVPRLANLLRKVGEADGDVIISYGSPHTQTERGFLSFAGTLIPASLFAAAALNGELKLHQLERIFSEKADKLYPNLGAIAQMIKDVGIVDVFGGGYAWPAMIDFESKMTESGLCFTQLHESKDFSHGRFMLSLRERGLRVPKLIFQIGDDPYENKLSEILERKSPHFLNVQSYHTKLLGGLEMLIEAQYLVKKIADVVHEGEQDISRPTRIPPAGLSLYHWKQEVEGYG